MQVRKNVLALSIVAVLGMVGTVHAQDQKPTSDKAVDLDKVVVSGIRGAQEKSLDTKRGANSHVEVVTAEDVGKLAAHNVADTLRQLPGVNISSSSADEGGFDEADRVSLRGTSPSLTQTLINGHSVGSADWFVLSQGNNVGRSVSYSLLPSELVSSVRVHKSSEAKYVEGGTTGNINIITRKPLEFAKELTFEGSLGAVRSDQADANDPQLSGLFNYRNEQGTFGVMVQAFKQKRHLRREAQEIPGGWFKITGKDDAGNLTEVGLNNPDLVGVWAPGLLGSTLFEQTRDRVGGLLEVQFKPTDNLTLGMSGFSSDMKANNYNRNFMLWGSHFANTESPNAGYVVKDGVLTSATYAGKAGTDYAVYDMIARESRAKTKYYTFDADWNISDSLVGKFQVGTTKGVGTTPRQFIAEVTLASDKGASWASHGNSAPLDWSVGGDTSPAGVTSFGTWGNQEVRAEDKENWGSADFSKFFDGNGNVTSVDFGLRYSKHNRDSISPEGASPGNIWAALKNGATTAYPGGFANTIGGNFPRDLWYFNYDALKDAVVNNSTWLSNDDSKNGRHNWGSDWHVSEKNLALYAQANLQGENWTGNVGLRYVNIKQDILTYQSVSDIANADVSSLFAQGPGPVCGWGCPVWGGWKIMNYTNKYNKFLPSANFKYQLAEDRVFRLAASQTMTLPDYSALGASSWGSDLNLTGGGGNPNLKPVISTNFDASYEWYFTPRGLLAASVYSMHLKDYVAFGVVDREMFSEQAQGLRTYHVSIPMNVSGDVRGFELTYQQPLGDNFGFDANYTYADGKVNGFQWADGSNSLVGTSKNTYNMGAWFENDRFGARISYSYRDAFLIGLSGANPYYQADFGTVSASLSYKATDWLSISLDAMNLNNPSLYYYQSATIPTAFYNNGRQYYLNFRFKF